MFKSVFTVTKFEVIRQLKKPSFWVSLLLFPLGIVFFFWLSAVNSANSNNLTGKVTDTTQFGITDSAKILPADSMKEPYHVYPDKNSGLEALKTGKIEAYYYLPDNFAEKLQIETYVIARNDNIIGSGKYQAPIRSLLSASATKDVDPVKIALITEKYQVNIETLDETTLRPVNLLGRAIVPLLILGIFYLLIVVFGNRLLMSVIEEKENRVSEMILTAVSARHLIIGKLLAMMLLGFLQVAFIIMPAVCMLIIKRSDPFIVSILSSVEFNPLIIASNILLLLVSYFFFAAICTFVGSLTSTARDASQYMGVAIMTVVMPFFFINSFISPDASFITYFMSYFPLSSPVALMLRNAFGNLSLIELIGGLAAVTFYAIIAAYFAIRSFEKHAINFSLVKPNFNTRKAWKKFGLGK